MVKESITVEVVTEVGSESTMVRLGLVVIPLVLVVEEVPSVLVVEVDVVTVAFLTKASRPVEAVEDPSTKRSTPDEIVVEVVPPDTSEILLLISVESPFTTSVVVLLLTTVVAVSTASLMRLLAVLVLIASVVLLTDTEEVAWSI